MTSRAGRWRVITSYSIHYTKLYDLKLAAVDSESIAWDSAHLVVSEIKFEAELKSLVTGEDSIEIEYKWHGPEMVDLLNSYNFV